MDTQSAEPGNEMNSSVPSAYAVVHGDDTRFYAASIDVLERVLGLHLVAALPANRVSTETKLQYMRQALREGRWADALVAWIEETDKGVDVFDETPDVWDSEAKIWSEEEVPHAVVLDLLGETALFAPAPVRPGPSSTSLAR